MVIKTEKVKFVNHKTLIATADVGKDSISCYLQGPQGQEVKPFRASNEINGLTTFWGRTIATMKKYQCDQIIVGFESTGCYSQPLINFMKNSPVILVQVNPMHTKKMKEVVDNSPNKTDKKDPRVIADIIRLGHYLSVVIPEGASAELRELSLARESQKRQRTAMFNRFETLMFKIFPEFVKTN